MRKLLIFITLCLFMVNLSYAQHPMHKITGTEQDTIWVKDGATIDSGLVVNGNIECDTITAYVPITSIAWDTLASYLDTTNLSSPTFTDSVTIDGVLDVSSVVTFDSSLNVTGYTIVDDSLRVNQSFSATGNIRSNGDITMGGFSSVINAGAGGIEMGASKLSFINGADSSSIKDSTGYGLKLKSDNAIYANDVMFSSVGAIVTTGNGISFNGSNPILDMKQIGSYLAIIKYGLIANDTFWVATDTISF